MQSSNTNETGELLRCFHSVPWACRLGSRQQLSLQPTASAGLLDRAQTSAHHVNGHDHQVQYDISQLPICKTVAYAVSGVECFTKLNLMCSVHCKFLYVTHSCVSALLCSVACVSLFACPDSRDLCRKVCSTTADHYYTLLTRASWFDLLACQQ